MAAWAKAYTANKAVKEIKMTQNGIRQEGIIHLLTNGLSNTPKLSVLDLQDNTFTATGATALSNVVGGWAELKELGVGDCLLSKRGGIALAKALSKGSNPKLEVLRLQYNEINAHSVKGLADAHTKLPALRRVELNGNQFEEEDPSLEKLREVLEKRKEDADGVGEDDENYWGIDDLDDLEEEDEDEDEDQDEAATASDDEEEGVEVEEKAARELVSAQQAEEENVPLRDDKKVDELADALAKTQIK